MRFTLGVLALSLLLTACSQRDTLLGQQIAGTWTREGASTVTITPGGGFFVVSRKPGQTNYFAGTWQVRGGIFVMTMTNGPAFNGNALVGTIDRYRIIHVDNHQFVCEEEGQTITLTR